MGRVVDTKAMISGMSPELVAGAVDFCALPARDPRLPTLIEQSHTMFGETEGVSLFLPVADMSAEGLPETPPMAQITLNEYSSLEGVGLPAAVAARLANAGIACNKVAAFQHDQALVPFDRADEALWGLPALAGEA